MQALRDLQTRFINCLTDGPADMAALIEADSEAEQAARLGIYKNAYRVRLRQVIETDHEMLWTYLGDEHFESLVAGYVAANPSHYTSLRNYCDRLPAYLADTEPFSAHPILAEIAQFERLLMDVFDAAEADRTNIDALRALDPNDWPDMRLRLHPSVQILRTEWNSVESWKALKDDGEPATATNETTQHWLLWRDTDRLSQFRHLETDEHAILSLAIAGECFSTLCEALLTWHPVEQTSVVSLRYITEWLDQGLIAAIEAGAEHSTPQPVQAR